MVGDFERRRDKPWPAFADDDVAAFTRANALHSLDRFDEAAKVFEDPVEQISRTEPRPRGGWLDAMLETFLTPGLVKGKDVEGADEPAQAQLESAPG